MPAQVRPLAVPRVFDRLVRLPAAHAWMAVLLLVDLAALGDLASGPQVWFGPVYLFVICIAAWSLGWKAGQSTGVGCMLLTFAINGVAIYPYALPSVVALNVLTRFVAISFIVAIIAGARRAYLREWWLARTDILTGALNRQAFFDLGEVLSASTCWRLLVYADLDGLKAVNDGQGHAAGDACLRTYAAAVRRMIRRNDLFARVGGDEFLVFMPVKNEAAARTVAERLHQQMNAISSESGCLRCSLGGLMVPPGALVIDDLVRQADNLMYLAKVRGAGLEVGMAAKGRSEVNPGRARKELREQPRASLETKPFIERRETTAAPAMRLQSR